MSAPEPVLVGHALCPYAQRVAIALAEQGIAHRRIDVDLGTPPEWFVALSPLGKVPLLRVGEAALFESAVILEYLEETGPAPLHPADPLDRARVRAWIEAASQALAIIGRLYSAPDEAAVTQAHRALAGLVVRLEGAFGPGPWFGGARFTLADAAWAPVFRYLDAFERIGLSVMPGAHTLAVWRADLARRPSVVCAVAPDYSERLWAFLAARPGPIGQRVRR